MTSKKKIIFTGWGTWGHTTPLVSLYNYLWEAHNYEYMWIWERNSLEEEVANTKEIPFHDISAGKIRRYFDLRNFYEPLKNLTGIFESLYCLLKYKWDFIFSKWGFVSVPACIAGWILRKKVFIHESDSVMGLANKITSKLATKVFYSFPNEKWGKHIFSGPIMNPEMLDSIVSVSKEENEKLNVLVIAGSQWSQRIFEGLLQILPDCRDIEFHVILGTNDDSELKTSFSNYGNVKTYGFIPQSQLAKLYVKCDIAITRGSSTLWELYYFGIHSIIVPLKATGWNHQYHNWVYFNENYGSDLLDEDDNLHLEMFRKLQAYKSLRKTGLNLEGYLDGLKTISEEIK